MGHEESSSSLGAGRRWGGSTAPYSLAWGFAQQQIRGLLDETYVGWMRVPEEERKEGERDSPELPQQFSWTCPRDERLWAIIFPLLSFVKDVMKWRGEIKKEGENDPAISVFLLDLHLSRAVRPQGGSSIDFSP